MTVTKISAGHGTGGREGWVMGRTGWNVLFFLLLGEWRVGSMVYFLYFTFYACAIEIHISSHLSHWCILFSTKKLVIFLLFCGEIDLNIGRMAGEVICFLLLFVCLFHSYRV